MPPIFDNNPPPPSATPAPAPSSSSRVGGTPMFDPQVLSDIAERHKPTLMTLLTIHRHLNDRMADMEEAILAVILAIASGEPLLFVGPPGTAKSHLIRLLCQYLGIDPSHSKEDERYFEYLLTPFTEPGELFGYYNIAKAQSGILERDTKGMMQHAQVVYLDEVFNGSSAILNSLLAFMNERVFHDRGKRTKVAMKAMFGATNQTPRTPELRAVFDRFLLRYHVDNVEAKHKTMSNLFQKGWSETYIRPPVKQPAMTLLKDLENLRDDIHQESERGRLAPAEDSAFYEPFISLVDNCRLMNYSAMSSRRLVKMLHVMVIHSMYTSFAHETMTDLVTKEEARSRQAQQQGQAREQLRSEKRLQEMSHLKTIIDRECHPEDPTRYYFYFHAGQMRLLRFAVDQWDDTLDDIFRALE